MITVVFQNNAQKLRGAYIKRMGRPRSGLFIGPLRGPGSLRLNTLIQTMFEHHEPDATTVTTLNTTPNTTKHRSTFTTISSYDQNLSQIMN